MIILIGPDGTGKTTLAHRLAALDPELSYHHYSYKDGYSSYIEDMTSLSLLNAVMDRCPICEIPYHKVMNRQFQFTNKEFHNLMLMMLSYYPIIVLCIHKPDESTYAADQYMPYAKWDECLRLYEQFLKDNLIQYFTYNYTYRDGSLIEGIGTPEDLVNFNAQRYGSMFPWIRQWLAGYGSVGYKHPTNLIVAERIGPHNSHFIPFEAGPTGQMMSDLFDMTKTPLGATALTNMVKLGKSISRSSAEYQRKANEEDLDLFRKELNFLQPAKVIFMGNTSKQAGAKICKELNIPYDSILHLGALNHKGIRTINESYAFEWKRLLNIKSNIIQRKFE